MATTIVITGTANAPKWETIQQLLRDATSDNELTVTRIRRPDGGNSYRAPGTYHLQAHDGFGGLKHVTLVITGVA